jgi:beta-phosphoglucomutase-like phosphatase (HAD superfamily)
VTADERELAFANIKKAAKQYGVDMSESSSSELGTRPSTGRTTADRKKSARKAAATRKRKSTGAAKKTTTRKTTPARKKARKRSG